MDTPRSRAAAAKLRRRATERKAFSELSGVKATVKNFYTIRRPEQNCRDSPSWLSAPYGLPASGRFVVALTPTIGKVDHVSPPRALSLARRRPLQTFSDHRIGPSAKLLVGNRLGIVCPAARSSPATLIGGSRP